MSNTTDFNTPGSTDRFGTERTESNQYAVPTPERNGSPMGNSSSMPSAPRGGGDAIVKGK
jgi:hypothetical protein